MNSLSALGIAFGALRDRKLRAILTITGVAIGPAVIVALNATTSGFSFSLTERFSRMGLETIMVQPATGRIRLASDDATKLSQIEGVKAVLPIYRIPATLQFGSYTRDILVTAVELNKLATIFPNLAIDEGELPKDSNFVSAVVGYNLAHPSDPEIPSIGVNQAFTLSTMARRDGRPVRVTNSFLVRATTDKFGQALFLDIDGGVFIPLKAGETLSRLPFSGFLVIAENSQSVLDVQEAINQSTAGRFRAVSVTQIVSQIQSITAGITNFLGTIALMSLAVAFIGIMTTMFTSVSERIREIGLLKALGYSKGSIIFIFLSESALTGLLGGLMGSAAGVALSSTMTSFFSSSFRFGPTPIARPPPTARGAGPQPPGALGQPSGPFGFGFEPMITPELVLTSIALAVLVGIVAGIIPAWRASRLTPVDALRHQ